MSTTWAFQKVRYDDAIANRLIVITDGTDVLVTTFWPDDYESQEDYKRDVIDCIRSISKRLNKKWWQFWVQGF